MNKAFTTLALSALWLSVCTEIWVLLSILTFLKIFPVIQHVEFALGVVAAIGEIIIIIKSKIQNRQVETRLTT